MWDVLVLVLIVGYAIPICTSEAQPYTEAVDDGLEAGDIAAIVLAILWLILILLAIVTCILYKKGYIGYREDQVLPLFPDIYTTPESLQKYSEATVKRSYILEQHKYREDPIIFMHDDIYYPPKSRPLPNDGIYPEPNIKTMRPTGVAKIHGVVRKPSRRRRHSEILREQRRKKPSRMRRHSEILRKPRELAAPRSPSIASYPEDAVFIPDKGGMKFTMLYETQSPYADRGILSKAV